MKMRIIFYCSNFFSSSKTKLEKSSHSAINHQVGSEPHCQQWGISAQSARWHWRQHQYHYWCIHLSPLLSKRMISIKPPGIKWVVNLLKLKIGYACDIFTLSVQSQEKRGAFLGISCKWPLWVIKHILYDYWKLNEIFLED
jgi:hypothetical protein